MNRNEIEEVLLDNGLDGAIYFENPSYADAIIGYTSDNRIVYDYNLMVESLMKEDNISEIDAIEFIEYNTIRALGYIGNECPIIVYPLI